MGWIRYKTALKKSKDSLKIVLEDLSNYIKQSDLDEYFYFDSAPACYKSPFSKMLICKVSFLCDASKIKHKELKMLKINNEIKFSIDKSFIKFRITGGKNGSGKLPIAGEIIKSPATNQQELAIIFAIESDFEPTLEDFKEKINFLFNETWFNTFKKIREIRKMKYYNSFSQILHDGTDKTFSKKLFKLCKLSGQRELKDNWNPADMWIVNSNPISILNDFENVAKKGNSLNEFNDLMKEYFYKNILIGVSLKMISSSKVKFDIIDPSKREFIEHMFIKSIRHTKGTNSFAIITNTDYEIKAGYKGSSGSSRLYFEGRKKNAKVQLGAISMIQLNDWFKKLLDIDFNKTQKYPDYEFDIKIWREKHIQETIQFFIDAEKKDKNFIKETFYMSMKQTKISSIYLKVY